VPSVHAGAPRNTYKKQTNQLVKNNVGKTIQFMKKISISNFWKNKGMIREFAWLFGVLLSKKGGKWFERCWIITIMINHQMISVLLLLICSVSPPISFLSITTTRDPAWTLRGPTGQNVRGVKLNLHLFCFVLPKFWYSVADAEFSHYSCTWPCRTLPMLGLALPK
jgi:hypothetical protein